MSAERTDDYRETLRVLVYRLAEQGMSVDDIQQHPDVKHYLSVVRPPDMCETFTHHRYLQSLIQRAKNPDGTRRFVSIQLQTGLFPAFSEEAREDARKNTFYASLTLVEQTPKFKAIALRGLQGLINGGIRNAGYISPELRDELIRLIGQVFDQIIGQQDTGT